MQICKRNHYFHSSPMRDPRLQIMNAQSWGNFSGESLHSAIPVEIIRIRCSPALVWLEIRSMSREPYCPLGYKLSSEEFPAPELVRLARRAEDSSFNFALLSDHYHPWTNREAHSPSVWSVIGGIAHTRSKPMQDGLMAREQQTTTRHIHRKSDLEGVSNNVTL